MSMLFVSCSRDTDLAQTTSSAELPRLIVHSTAGTNPLVSYYRISTDALDNSITLTTDSTGGKFVKYYYDAAQHLIKVERSDTFNVLQTWNITRDQGGSEITISKGGEVAHASIATLSSNRKRIWYRQHSNQYMATEFITDDEGLVLERMDTTHLGPPYQPNIAHSRYYYNSNNALDSVVERFPLYPQALDRNLFVHDGHGDQPLERLIQRLRGSDLKWFAPNYFERLGVFYRFELVGQLNYTGYQNYFPDVSWFKGGAVSTFTHHNLPPATSTVNTTQSNYQAEYDGSGRLVLLRQTGYPNAAVTHIYYW